MSHLRLDRFLTLYFFNPLRRKTSVKKGIRIPILMYHSISDDQEDGHPYFWINTSPALFAEHMKFLHENDYSVITLNEAVGIISSGSYEPDNQDSFSSSNHPIFHHSSIPKKKLVVLTFDDGYHDFYTHAFPIMKKCNFTGIVFLPTAFIGNVGAGIKGKKHLTWEEVRELQTEGIEFGSHTVNHPQLHELKTELIEYEIRSSKAEIENKAGHPVKSFSYPYKFPEQNLNYINMFQGFLRKAGYQRGVSTKIGTIHQDKDIFFLRRIPLNSDDDISFLRAKLEGNYDWVSYFQRFSKKLRGFLKKKRKISPHQ